MNAASSIAILLLTFIVISNNSCCAFVPLSRVTAIQTTTTSPIIYSSLSAIQSINKRRKQCTSLRAATPSVISIASTLSSSFSALTATATGGVFSGSLHAIAGPDHLAALIPRCCGLPWYRAARVGALWGLGHGMSATLLGMAGYLFKRGVSLTSFTAGNDFDLLNHAGGLMELAIGISLIVTGLLGIKEAREWKSPNGIAKPLSSAASPESMAMNPYQPAKRVLFNGLLHGFSWDGAPSLAPAVAIATLRGSLTFLISYALGTMAMMTLATSLIGEGTRRAAGKLDRPDLPRDLSVGSSLMAMIVGLVWCWLSLR